MAPPTRHGASSLALAPNTKICGSWTARMVWKRTWKSSSTSRRWQMISVADQFSASAAATARAQTCRPAFPRARGESWRADRGPSLQPALDVPPPLFRGEGLPSLSVIAEEGLVGRGDGLRRLGDGGQMPAGNSDIELVLA